MTALVTLFLTTKGENNRVQKVCDFILSADLPDRFAAFSPVDGACTTFTQHEYILHTRAALAASPLGREIVAEAVQWQPITDETPTDTVLLLGWHGFGGAWETATDYWYNSRGKWYHGSATHWMPLPAPPAAIRARGEG